MANQLCEKSHRRLVAGKCPWCGRYVLFGTADDGAAITFGADTLRNQCVEFMEQLNDVDERTKWRIIDMLVSIHSHDFDVVPVLVDMLHSDNPSARALATFALAGVDPQHVRTVPAIIDQLSDLRYRKDALYFLAEFSASAASAATKLAEIVSDDRAEMTDRQSAAHILGQIGREAKDTVPALLAVLKVDRLREEAQRALAKILPSGGW